MSSRVTTTITGHVAEVCLNRPEKKNALDAEMFQAIPAAGEALMDNTDVRAVVLTGAGGTFCAGIDTSSFMSMAGDIENVRHNLLNPPDGQTSNNFQRPSTVWQDLPVPVIAAIEGVAFGGGIQIALGTDFRIAAPDARLSIMETRWGIIPDMGITQSLPKLMRADQAKELIMTARIIGAEEALSLGLITRISEDPKAAAHAFAEELAGRNPAAIRASKRLVEETWTGDLSDLALEASLQAPIIGSPNQIETVMAEMQGRPAKFK